MSENPIFNLVLTGWSRVVTSYFDRNCCSVFLIPGVDARTKLQCGDDRLQLHLSIAIISIAECAMVAIILVLPQNDVHIQMSSNIQLLALAYLLVILSGDN